MFLNLDLCEGANPKSNSVPIPEVVKGINIWFCMELFVSPEIGRELKIL